MSYNAIAFYITAHEDDWELFRGEVAYSDANNPVNKIVFIHTTAGDAGETDGWWEAREGGAVAAVRSALSPHPLTTHVATVRCHPVQRYVCRNTVIYFLRLPDGNPSGSGYPSTNHESLSQLRDSGKPVSAVDGSTTYTSWADFCETIVQIVASECLEVAQAHPWLNVSDYCSTTNPGDHADHKATADAVRTFASTRFNRAWFLTYCTEGCAPNLTGAALTNKKRTFDAYGAEVQRMTTLDGSPVGPNQGEWSAWGAKSYVRLVPFGQPDVDNPPPPAGCPSTGAAFVSAVDHPSHARPRFRRP